MHLDEGTIHAWLDGALDAEEASRVERHAAECGACAAAVAEARGLVAGASRILTALDGVAGGIVPKTDASTVARHARRGRSLWTTLHLTPARAAAAAVVVLAAGTALVVRNAPNAAQSAIKVAHYPSDSTVTLQPAAPLAVPNVAPDTIATRALSAPARKGPPSSRVAIGAAAPRPAPTSSRRSVMAQGEEGRAKDVQVAEKARALRTADQVALADSTRATSADSLATKKELAEARRAVADNASRGGVAGAAATAAAPPSAVAQRNGAPSLSQGVRGAAGCYVVTADSAVGLPPRLWLDSSLVSQPPMLQRPAGGAADGAALERHGVSEVLNEARRSIAGAYWTPRRDGSIRLSVPTNSVNVDLYPASASTLVGATPFGNRSLTVTLRRVECGSR